METKKILGLDIGSNSIGAALITIPKSIDDFGKQGSIEWIGSRIIPVDGDYLQKFESGARAETKAAARRMKRGSRRLKHRYKLRRSRLIRIFKILGWIDEMFPIDNVRTIKNIIKETGKFSFRISDFVPIAEETYREFYNQFGFDESAIAAIIEKMKFRRKHNGKKKNKGINLLPEDWVVYYLRKKALTAAITTNELIRIIYLMNQRRGFKSSRKDLKETAILNFDDFIRIKKEIEDGSLPKYKEGKGEILETKFVSITKIKSVEQKSDEKDKKGNLTFVITAEDPHLKSWEEKRKKAPEWVGKEVTLVVTQKIDEHGKHSQNKPQLPTEDDWELNMVALDNQIGDKTPGAFFWDKLVETKGNYKIRQQTIRREKYQNELETIWKKQCELNPELSRLNNDKEILKKCAEALYPAQSKFKGQKYKEILANDLLHLISKDIIYYQRDLKSQKKLISTCRYEKHKGIDGEVYGVKCAPKSIPEFQEFRIWQDIHNIRIFEKEKRVNGTLKIDADVTRTFINEEIKEILFELFDSSRVVKEKDIFKKINDHLRLTGNNKLNEEKYRINLFASRSELPGNETKEVFRKVFRKHNYELEGEKLLSDKNTLYQLWHILYSITSSDLDKSAKGIRNALAKFNLPETIKEDFTRLPEFKKQYASYSSKAIKKLLPLMRCGKYWSWEDIHNQTQKRIEKIITKGWDFAYDKRTGELIKEREFARKEQFAGLPVWLACYVVYGRHSERESDKKYTPDEIRSLDVLKLIPNNSLRNPIVEQVVRETILLVKDICNHYGQPDEIHIELSRELKKNAAEREKITQNNRKNLEEKQRIKKLLYELLKGKFNHYDEEGEVIETEFTVKPNPENPSDIEKFRIYKSCAAITSEEEKEHWDSLFKDGKKERFPTTYEIKKYILWLSQKCVSPYTGKIISLSKLFSEEYEIDHIGPKKRLKDDSLENRVICEIGVNKLKDNNLAMVFIKNNSGRELERNGVKYKILTTEEYINHCKKTFKGKKLKRLLSEEVPEDFIERQINDTRYITRKVGELLYPFAKEKEGLIFTIGSVTSDLKKEWGINNVWNEIVKSRFERLEEVTKNKYIIPDQKDKNKFHFNVPENPELDVKRIDHRHHALDALIIAATTREHIRYLNSLNAVDSNEELQKIKRALVKRKFREFILPWPSFTKDAKDKVQEIIVTFKSNNRIVTKPYNKYEKWVYENGEWKKKLFEQNENKRWMAIRKSLFKENPQGVIWIKEKKQIDVLDAFKVEIERMKVEQNSGKRKVLDYVYDQIARQEIKQIIENAGSPSDSKDELLEKIKNYLNKNSKKVPTGNLTKKGKPEYKTVYILGSREYEKIEVAKFTEYAAKRVTLDTSFTHDKIDKIPYANRKRSGTSCTHDKIDKSPYEKKKCSNIPELLRKHLEEYNDDPKEAFSGEGLEELAKKAEKPISRVTIYEKKSPEDRFGNKYVEVDKGANTYFIIYENKQTKERSEMYSLSVHKAIERIIQGKPIAERREGFNTIVLSPDDLVYIPTAEELKAIKENLPNPINWNDKRNISGRIYKMVSCSKKDCLFVQHHIAKAIIPSDAKKKIKGEIDWHDKSTKTMDGKFTISECCIKIKVDRLGNLQI